MASDVENKDRDLQALFLYPLPRTLTCFPVPQVLCMWSRECYLDQHVKFVQQAGVSHQAVRLELQTTKSELNKAKTDLQLKVLYLYMHSSERRMLRHAIETELV